MSLAKEQLIPNIEEQPIKPETEVNQEELIGGSIGASVKTEAQVALDITKKILGERALSEGTFEKSNVFQEVERILKDQAERKVADTIVEKEDLYKYLINGGQQALAQELYYLEESSFSEIEKEDRKIKLLEDYAESKIIAKTAAMEIIEVLLRKFLDPYKKTDELARFTNSKQNQEGVWISELDFDQVKKGYSSSFISPKTRDEICAGIQYTLSIKQNNEKLIQKNRGYDGRPNAKAIIRDFFGHELQGTARVISEGPLSITIVVNENDYPTFYPEVQHQ